MADSFILFEQPADSVPTTEPAPGSPSKPPVGPTTVPAPPSEGPVELRLIVSRQVGPNTFVPVAATHPRERPGFLTRDMKKVPATPPQVRLRTGDRVRVEVCADRPGYLTVFNVGPTGNLNLLFPAEALQSAGAPRPIEPNQPLHIVDVEMTPPAGRERLFAVWSRAPLRSEQLPGLHEQLGPSKPYRATRDMKRLQNVVQQLQPETRHVAVVEVDHVA